MTAGGDGTVERLFAEALERPVDERADWVVAHAGSETIREEVLSLLAAHAGHGPLDSIGEWMRGAASEAPSTSERSLLPRLQAGLRGRYRVVEEIARGGMAIVFDGEDVQHPRSVAIKVLRPSLGRDVGAARFLREIGIVSRLDHPCIVPVYDSGEANGLLYYVMPQVEGESLRERLAREGALELPETLRVVEDVAGALDHAHRHGVIHRDIKPGNIMLSGERALVTDFGIARAVGLERLTRTGVLLGTPTYVSPEQIERDREPDARSDIYSLACVTFEMLAGEPPFTGDSLPEVLHLHRSASPPKLRSKRRGAPRRVDAALRRALAKSPGDRFATAGDFAGALMRS